MPVQGARPMYEVIYRDLVEQIDSALLHPGERLPSETALAERYGVSRMTVRQAMDELRDDALIVRRRGSGTFVLPRRNTVRRLGRLGSFADESGLEASQVKTKVIAVGSEQAPARVAEALLVSEEETVTRIFRLRIIDGVPSSLQESWVPFRYAPGLGRGQLIEGSLYRTLREQYSLSPRWAEQEVRAVEADSTVAKHLDISPQAPVLAIRRRTFNQDRIPFEYAESYNRPNVTFTMELSSD